jgi:hypothetical protein
VKRESQRRYSLDEYFAVEETSHVKNEYYDGQVIWGLVVALDNRDDVKSLKSDIANVSRRSPG